MYGGTFDPIHCAHLIIAQYVKEELELDKVIFIPTGYPPHKEIYTPPEIRLKMVQLALAGHPNFEISEIEIHRDETSYSVETIEILKDELDALKDDLFWIIGSDSFLDLPKWQDPDKIFEMCRVVVFPRRANEFENSDNRFKTDSLCLEDAPVIEISSTHIRSLVRSGRSIKHWVPAAIEELIHSNKLYL